MKVFIWFMVLTGMPAIMGSLSGQSTRSSTSTPAAEEETDLELFEFYDRYKRSPLNIGSNSRRTRIQTKNKSKSKSKSSSSNSAGGSSYTYSDSSTANSINTSSGSVWKGNPDEYTIGGVLSGKSGVEHYFTRILSVSTIKIHFLLDNNNLLTFFPSSQKKYCTMLVYFGHLHE